MNRALDSETPEQRDLYVVLYIQMDQGKRVRWGTGLLIWQAEPPPPPPPPPNNPHSIADMGFKSWFRKPLGS